MEQTFLLLLHLLKDADYKNEYVRTLSVALVTWQPWMSRIPAVCFVEEGYEALLSRMGHRCDVYRTLHGFDNTLDLFLTPPPPKRGLKATRGMLKQGLVNLHSASGIWCSAMGRASSALRQCAPVRCTAQS